ncbi:uncharacterized protein ACLA_048520 [Aspergillus clavatus NRRL 1]|uniref:Uncharacterized protein n=1 Tax=Aspergillus clavatus (strain ATCC 1007 / CBS 513.65 / DSM 816 / NCTC 3887 / NRRL 1 / QM 1276 / 107) TaxID=344612 RepID=A1CHM7_ASPCL|nr:uncharacterized protein ACLA_048520 [Aspergillus clavatus NRRL 1]EAW10382.1 hypothetical protein ACLA_048520 [Aspergillus clavatus NRRL 1]
MPLLQAELTKLIFKINGADEPPLLDQIAHLLQHTLADAAVHIRDLPPGLCLMLYLSVVADGHLPPGQGEYEIAVARRLLEVLRVAMGVGR